MGTFGPGPLDNDTALDFVDNLAAIHPGLWPVACSGALDALNAYDPSRATFHTPQEVADCEGRQQEAIAAAAVLADAVIGETLYTSSPEEDADFDARLMPDVTRELLGKALTAVQVALSFVGHPDMGEWSTDEAAQQHVNGLRELHHWLSAALSQRGGTPPELSFPAEEGRITSRAQLAARLAAQPGPPPQLMLYRGGRPWAEVDLRLLLPGGVPQGHGDTT